MWESGKRRKSHTKRRTDPSLEDSPNPPLHPSPRSVRACAFPPSSQLPPCLTAATPDIQSLPPQAAHSTVSGIGRLSCTLRWLSVKRMAKTTPPVALRLSDETLTFIGGE